VITGIDEFDNSGASVSAAGDVNGDGVDDVIIGAVRGDPGGVEDAGESYVVFGSTERVAAVLPLASLYPAGGGDGSRGFVLTGIPMVEGFSGGSVSDAGDVNGDGIGDLIIGARHVRTPDGDIQAGEAYVLFGSAQAFPAVISLASLFDNGGGDGSRGFVLTGVDEGDYAGCSVSAAGDINGDGVGDLIVGANHAQTPDGSFAAGESYVVFGLTQGFPAVFELASLYPDGGGNGSRGFVLTGIDVLDYSGSSVSAAGDVNGDGVDDVIIGAASANPNGNSYAGESYVVFGSTHSFPAVIPSRACFRLAAGTAPTVSCSPASTPMTSRAAP
jgi:hypothetical protein